MGQDSLEKVGKYVYLAVLMSQAVFFYKSCGNRILLFSTDNSKVMIVIYVVHIVTAFF